MTDGRRPPAPELEQFRLLSRTSVRRLLDSALFSRDADPTQFAVWGLVLAAVPPAFFAARQIFTYAAMSAAVRRGIIAPERIEFVALAHQLFFVVYGMLAMTLLAALMWDALFPDREDQEIVGVLPVRPRTIAAARLTAALWVGLVFAAAIQVPTGVIHAFVSIPHFGLTGAPLLLAGHIVATMLACMTVFVALLAVRGVVAMLTGDRAGRWLAGGLQLITVILLVEVFFFLPRVGPLMVRAMLDGSTSPFPPVWFASLAATITVGARDAFIGPALLALLSAAIVMTAVAPIYLLPARWTARRVLHAKSADRQGLLTALARGVAGRAIPHPATRAIFLFAVASLARSRRHTLILASYFGLGVAMCIASLISWSNRRDLAFSQPEPYLLALPLVMTWFLVFGIRSALAVPTELEANWPFRLSLPRPRTAVNATGLVLFALAVVPVTALLLLVALPWWPLPIVAAAALLHLVSGALLVECVLHGWLQIPFARAHAPGSKTLRWKWFFFLIGLNLFAFQLSDVQVAALRSLQGVAWYAGILAAVSLAIHLWRNYDLRWYTLRFDAEEEVAVEALNLSEALR